MNEESYADQFVSQNVSILQKLPATTYYDPWSCVSYVKYRRPDQTEPWGTPNKVQAYDIAPYAGLIVITREGPYGHAGYIERVSDTTLFVSEANYVPGLVTRREIPRNSPVIRGFR